MTAEPVNAEPVSTAGCPMHFPFPKADPLDIQAEYGWLREHDPVTTVTLPSGDRAWLVTRYADVRAVLSDVRFSRDLNRPDAARMKTAIGFGNYGNPFADPPVHTRWRRLVARAFTPRQVEAMRPRVQATVDDLVEKLAAQGPPADLMAAFAYPLPITVICTMLGVPVADQAQFRDWVDTMLSSDHDPSDRAGAAGALIDYAKALSEDKRREPADDLLSGLVAVADDDDGRLTEEELWITVMTLLVAGYKTTAAEIGKGFLLLHRHPDQFAALRADVAAGGALVESATEEMLRCTPPGNGYGISRYATADVEIGGVLIPAGATVLVARHAANRDEAHFADGERFDITRGTANQNLTFGSGPAFCFGAPVARMELQLGFAALLRRFPELRLAVAYDDVRWLTETAAQAPEAVPVTW